jgi:hypothetical protein
MKNHRLLAPHLIFVLSLALLLAVVSAGRGAALQTTLSLDPEQGAYHPGDRFTVDVYLADVVDLYGADVQLAFDPALFAVVDANPAIPGVQITARSDLLWPDLAIKREADNSAGTIWYAVTQLNPRPPRHRFGDALHLRSRSSAARRLPPSPSPTSNSRPVMRG